MCNALHLDQLVFDVAQAHSLRLPVLLRLEVGPVVLQR